MDRTSTIHKPVWQITQSLVIAALFLISGIAYGVEHVTYFHNDNLGSPVVATDSSGNVVWHESYQPYGNRDLHEGDNQNSLWFTGKQEEATFGISNFGARWYDSDMGRFLSIDPVGASPANPESFNRYAYANNNPYRFVDPDGNASKLATLIKLTSKGVRRLARLTKEQAVRARMQGKNVHADTRQLSQQIEEAAFGKEDIMRHNGHDLPDGSKGLPHHQTDGKRGHTFWGKLTAGAAAVLIGTADVLDHVSEAAEALDPTTYLKSSDLPPPPGYDFTWYGAYEKVDPNAPDYYEAMRLQSEAMRKQNMQQK